MKTDMISFEHEWNKKDVVEFTLKHFILNLRGFLELGILLVIVILLSITISSEPSKNPLISFMIIMLPSFSFVILFYRKVVSKSLGKTRFISISENNFEINGDKISSLKYIVVSQQFLLINNYNSIFLIKVPVEVMSKTLEMIRLSDIEIIERNDNFSFNSFLKEKLR